MIALEISGQSCPAAPAVAAARLQAEGGRPAHAVFIKSGIVQHSIAGSLADSRPACTGVSAPDGLAARSEAGMTVGGVMTKRAYPVCQPTPCSCRPIDGCSHRRIPPSIYGANRCTRRRPYGQSGRNVTTGSNRFSSWSEWARVIVVVGGVFRRDLDGRGFVFIAQSHFLRGG